MYMNKLRQKNLKKTATNYNLKYFLIFHRHFLLLYQ